MCIEHLLLCAWFIARPVQTLNYALCYCLFHSHAQVILSYLTRWTGVECKTLNLRLPDKQLRSLEKAYLRRSHTKLLKLKLKIVCWWCGDFLYKLLYYLCCIVDVVMKLTEKLISTSTWELIHREDLNYCTFFLHKLDSRFINYPFPDALWIEKVCGCDSHVGTFSDFLLKYLPCMS